MKATHHPLLAIVAAGTVAAASLAAPALYAQSPSPSSQTDDLIDAAKRGLDKLQKQTKMRDEFAAEMKTFGEKQTELLKRLDALAKSDEETKKELDAAMRRNTELERRAETAVARQEQTIVKLNHALEKLEAGEAQSKKEMAQPSPSPAAALPSTETAKPTPSPAASPAHP